MGIRTTTATPHLVCCPRRRARENPDVQGDVTETCPAMAEEFGFSIEELAVEEDHVNVSLEFPSEGSIARVVGILKSISADGSCNGAHPAHLPRRIPPGQPGCSETGGGKLQKGLDNFASLRERYARLACMG